MKNLSQSNISQKPNPLWKYMGFGENFRPRLPSRNWMIFLSIVGSFATAVTYDKREKKRAQLKWCKLVEHVSREPLGSCAMPRKLTIYLEAPPMDGLRSAQDHFKEYVKPILVASGLDWEFIQGRKEGDIRAKVADRIRNLRTPKEKAAENENDEILRFRRKNSINEYEGPGGDVVIGRHTWKEYVRGLHEGWLGPLTEPTRTESDLPLSNPETELLSSNTEVSPEKITNQLDTTSVPETSTEGPKDLKHLNQSTPYISTISYAAAPIPTDIPVELEPSVPISFPHVLGFLNTPKRLFRFLNRRKLADNIGRETAAVILSTYRPYHTLPEQTIVYERSTKSDHHHSVDSGDNNEVTSEQQTALQDEEKEWHKSLWVHADKESERTWLCPIILDSRIASRMRRFELSADDDEKARNISVPEEEIEGRIKGSIRKVWRAGIVYFGYKKDSTGTSNRSIVPL